MPKAVDRPQSPSSPGQSGAASAQTGTAGARRFLQGGRGSRPSSNEVLSVTGAAFGAAGKNGRARTPALFDTWPVDLDGRLIELLSPTEKAEQHAISAIRASHPELPEDLIWSRIVYLGLTERKRRPYRKHDWTDAEDQILRNEYGRSRESSRSAIDKILEMHPEWSRDAIVWHARVLGLTQHRAVPHDRWSSTLDHYLLSLMGCQLETIARRLKRSKKAVLARLRRLGWGADFFGGFKTKDLVLDLRISEVVVNTWVRRGWLERKKGRITEESLRWLCRHHPEEIPF